ncbi:MAG: PTS ascorbate transporter subunit IIC [Coriobacteriia bacterium]|nr:PTS ascorbate transporter subunit IIC [Coriobacteriia bacterium]
MEALQFIKELLSTPAIFIGIIALIGLLLQRKDAQTVVKGTIKSILGFVILNAGAAVIQQAIIPFGDLFQISFNIHGVVPNNEAITSLGLTQYAIETSSIFAIGMIMNIILARFSKLKYIFLSGHHSLYMSCLIAIILKSAGMEGWMLIATGSLLLGLCMCVFPAIMQPTMRKITGNDTLALGHFGTCCYWLSAQIGKLMSKIGDPEKAKTTEDVNFPKSVSFLRDNSISISIIMFICYFVVAIIANFGANSGEAAAIFKGSNWFLYATLQSITFAAGIYIVLAGVRMLIAEIVPAFKGISEKVVPNAKPALDCPTVFPFAPNAVLIGFLSSFVGGIVGLAVLALLGQTGLAVAIILPGAVAHFFCGATAGVCGNARGGLKGCIAGAFVHGIAITLLAAALLPVLGDLGFANTTFADTDFCVVGIVFGNIAKLVSSTGLFVIVIVLFLLPIAYNYTIGRKTGKKESK